MFSMAYSFKLSILLFWLRTKLFFKINIPTNSTLNAFFTWFCKRVAGAAPMKTSLTSYWKNSKIILHQLFQKMLSLKNHGINKSVLRAGELT